MDRITTNQQRLAYAKVCVEIKDTMDIPRFIEVELRSGTFVSVNVEVPWLLVKCSQCIFGHGDKSYPKR